jgi:hypothetical protein
VIGRPAAAEPGVETATEVESGLTERARLPVEPGAVEPVPGTNTAVRCAGDPAAANEVWQVATVLDGLTASPGQPAIATPEFWNVIVPDGAPVPPSTVATSVTGWLVIGEEVDAKRDVVLGPADCTSVAVPFATPYVAVTVDEPTVLEPLSCTV